VRPVKLWLAAVIAAFVIAAGVGVGVLWQTLENPDALWTVVQRCVAAKQHGHTLRAGCLSVDLKDQIAILPGLIGGRWHFLAVPTVRITGIEDPKVMDPHAPNYWALAWVAAQHYLPSRVTKDRTRIGLAVNSEVGRSQNQLHIHIACLKMGVRLELAADEDRFGPSWSAPILVYGPQMYRVMRVEGDTLDGVDPFTLLLRVPGAADEIGAHTLVVTGATWDRGVKRGFYILDDRASDTPDGPDHGHGEDLLDENCRSR